MSAGSRQEVMIRSLMEGLVLTLKKKLEGQPRQKPKLLALGCILAGLEALWKAYPIELSQKEGARVSEAVLKFNEDHKTIPGWGTPEVLIAFVLALGDHLWKRLPSGLKKMGVEYINREIQALYDTFDRQGAKLALMEEGGRLADELLGLEV